MSPLHYYVVLVFWNALNGKYECAGAAVKRDQFKCFYYTSFNDRRLAITNTKKMTSTTDESRKRTRKQVLAFVVVYLMLLTIIEYQASFISNTSNNWLLARRVIYVSMIMGIMFFMLKYFYTIVKMFNNSEKHSHSEVGTGNRDVAPPIANTTNIGKKYHKNN